MKHLVGALTLALLAVGCGRTEELPPLDDELSASEEQALTELQLGIDETAMDKTVAPCDDFYRYACGGFLDKTQLAGDDDWISRSFNAAEQANQDALAEIFARVATAPANDDDAKLAKIYGSCVDALTAPTAPTPEALEASLLKAIAPFDNERRLQGIGVALARTTLLLNQQPFIRVSLTTDEKDSNQVLLFVGPTVVTQTREQLLPLLTSLYPAATDEARGKRADLVLKVAEGIQKARGTDDKARHPLDVPALKTIMPTVRWDDLLKTIGTPKVKKVVVVEINALNAIDKLLRTLTAEEMDAYFDFHYRRTLRSNIEFSVPVETAKSVCNDRVLDLAFVASVIEPHFFETFLGQKNAQAATAMIKKIKTTFGQQIESNAFLDLATRVEAQAKLRAMTVTPLKPPAANLNVVTPGSNWTENFLSLRAAEQLEFFKLADKTLPAGRVGSPFITNAFYSPTNNQFEIETGILHGAFFSPAAAKSLNFGAIGWVIGHEITHGFDNSGRRFDATGSQRDWWSPSVAQAFEDRAQCFVSQYGSFPVPEVKDAQGAVAHLNGEQTLGENIADNGGIRTAYAAAEGYFRSQKSLKGFTPQQQFFLAGAQLWCEKVGAKVAEQLLRTDSHSNGVARVNLTFSNFEKFAEAFQCQPGAKMVSAPQCRVW